MKTMIFTCAGCTHEWSNSIHPQVAPEIAARGCPECKSLDVTFAKKKNDDAVGNGGPMAIDASRLGRHKPAKAFTEGVLKRIKSHHAHTNISVD